MATITTLASFDGEDGLQPLGNLVADAAGDLFGVTSVGGAHGEGEVFEIAKTPAGYADTPTILGSFDSLDDGVPTGALIMDGSGDLFGETEADNYGTVFEIAKTATGYASTPTILASFDMYGEDDSTGGPTGNLVADANGDLFGSTVNLASRLSDVARPGTVLVDGGLAEVLAGESDLTLRPVRLRPLKGIGPVPAFKLRR